MWYDMIMSSTKSRKEEIEPSSIGPVLPPHFSRKESVEDKNTEIECVVIEPALPPPHHLLNKISKAKTCIGPQIPQHLLHKLQNESSSITQNTAENSNEEEIYGPLPASEVSYSNVQVALEERALQLKMDQLKPSKAIIPVREEWMLELPEVKSTNPGLGPKQFRSKEGPDLSDRSLWTDTPKKKKQNEETRLRQKTEIKEIQRKNEEQERIAKKYKKKNIKSLLEMHQNEMKKMKKGEGSKERRPFSREIDLKVNRFDDAQKKAVLKKAQLLDDRFSSGHSKFL